MRILILAVVTVSFNLAVYAIEQNKIIINGIVIDGNQGPIPAVDVVELGTNNGTITNSCGEFRIEVHSESFTLIFHGMSYDDIGHPIKLTKADINGDTILFQIGQEGQDKVICEKKRVDKFRRFLIK